MTTLRALVAEAARLDVSITVCHLDPPLRAHYDHDRREIVVDFALTMPEKKEAIAHELGHAFYGHNCSTPANEAAAFRRAALLLVTLDAYRRAEAIDSNPVAIANELGVTKRIIRIWQKTYLPALALRRA